MGDGQNQEIIDFLNDENTKMNGKVTHPREAKFSQASQ